jgi:ketosteroid isomerase-like protein
MIGALLLQQSLEPELAQAVESRDVESVMRLWAEDGLLEYGGTHTMAGTFAGAEEVRGWFERWFERTAEVHVDVGRVAVARPWAIGLSNTLMFEAHLSERLPAGPTVETDAVVVARLRRGKVVHVKTYMYDETPELALWGGKARDRTASGIDVLIPGRTATPRPRKAAAPRPRNPRTGRPEMPM